jgi:hypothetical protein
MSLSNFGVMSTTGVIADIAGMPSAFKVNAMLFILAPVLIYINRKQSNASL